jgi:hypothetical protein
VGLFDVVEVSVIWARSGPAEGGNSMLARIAMIAMTTSSSIKVKAVHGGTAGVAV